MHPRSLLEEELKSTGEGKVFAALRDGLSDEWEVFHSASVVFRDHAAGAQDDESDFVLSHPEKGIVSLEVKGGGIECATGSGTGLLAAVGASVCATRSPRRSIIATS